MVTVLVEDVCVTILGQVLIVQLLFAQTAAQVMVYVMMMEAVIVTLDWQVVIVQFLLYQLHKHIYKAPQTQINKH